MVLSILKSGGSFFHIFTFFSDAQIYISIHLSYLISLNVNAVLFMVQILDMLRNFDGSFLVAARSRYSITHFVPGLVGWLVRVCVRPHFVSLLGGFFAFLFSHGNVTL